MLKLKNVSKFYYSKGIIATGFTRVNLELKIGEFVVITGESGSGKSTLLNVISGLDSYEEGEMYINSQETSHYTEKDFEDYRRKYIANIFQSFNLINSYTVYQNVELVLLLNGYKKHDVKKKILDIIDQVGLTQFKNTKVSKLSGGQKQRVAIARAMVKETPIIVADEPTGNLDSKSAAEVIEILKNVAKDRLVVVVTHNIEQVEKYATRVIKMSDGRIIENREIKPIKKEPQVQESEYNNLKLFNKYRLGLRNTFNILTKFLLLFAVFLFMSASVLAEYAGFQMTEADARDFGFSLGFRSTEKERIIINKKDRTQFTQEEYDQIKCLENVDYIVKDDIMLDSGVYISSDNGEVGMFGGLNELQNFRGELDSGRMPENEDEIIVVVNEDSYYFDSEDMILNKMFSVYKPQGIMGSTDETIKEVVVVGIKYTHDSIDYNPHLYVGESVINLVRANINMSYSTVKVWFNDTYGQYIIEPNDNVEPHEALVDDDFKYEFKNNNIINQPINIFVNNIYYEDELNLAMTQTYTKYNYTRLTGLSNYENNRYKIYINTDEYNSLFDRESYQSSVYVKDAKLVDETLEQLNSLGFNAKKVTDFKVDTSMIEKQILKIVKVVVTIIILVVLFFISYIIVKIILKSRNIYYTTLRMLGATYKNVRSILDIELFINSTVAYGLLMLFIYLTRINIISAPGIARLSTFLSLREYIRMYVILVLMSRLISHKFARKVFKNSAISTYNEEV